MSGRAQVPVDLLVDIEGPNERLFTNNAATTMLPDDDPFELCSMQGRASKKDLGLELGLALEKSIKIRSQANSNEIPTAETPVNSTADLGILVKIEDSPDKKLLSATPAKSSNRDCDTVFTHTSSNPFELAWDVIEQEALTLANNIQHGKEKPISPRKMVDMAMKLSPDSLLLSPRNPARDEEFLINSSPEQEMKKTTKPNKMIHSRGRPSIGASPVIAPRSYSATPMRPRTSLAPQPSPLRKATSKPLIAPSPAKPSLQRAALKSSLMRSSSATAPLNQIPGMKPGISSNKAAPMKAVHQTSQPLQSTSRAPLKTSSDTPLKRSVVPAPLKAASDTPLKRSVVPPSLPTPGQAPKPLFQSKLRAPLSRTESETSHATSRAVPDVQQRAGSIRYGIKRPSVLTATPSSSSNITSRSSILPRLKSKGRENFEPV